MVLWMWRFYVDTTPRVMFVICTPQAGCIWGVKWVKYHPPPQKKHKPMGAWNATGRISMTKASGWNHNETGRL